MPKERMLVGSLGPYTLYEKDVTTLYEAFRSCSKRKLAEAMLECELDACNGDSIPCAHLGVMTRKTADLLSILMRLGPDMDSASERIFYPWEPFDAGWIARMPWQKALGTRIAMPSFLCEYERYVLLGNVLCKMARL